MARPIKYRHPRTRLNTRILATVYANIHKAARLEQRTVGEIVQEACEQWLMASGYLQYRPDMTLAEVQALLADLPEHPLAQSLIDAFTQGGDRDRA